MPEKLLSKKNLECLVRKLVKLPVQEWEKEEQAIPSGGAMFPYTRRIISYSTSLAEFKVCLKREYDLYTLQIDSPPEEVEELSNKNNKSRIAITFEQIEKNYEAYQKQQEMKKQQDILNKFLKAIQ